MIPRARGLPVLPDGLTLLLVGRECRIWAVGGRVFRPPLAPSGK